MGRRDDNVDLVALHIYGLIFHRSIDLTVIVSGDERGKIRHGFAGSCGKGKIKNVKGFKNG